MHACTAGVVWRDTGKEITRISFFPLFLFHFIFLVLVSLKKRQILPSVSQSETLRHAIKRFHRIIPDFMISWTTWRYTSALKNQRETSARLPESNTMKTGGFFLEGEHVNNG